MKEYYVLLEQGNILCIFYSMMDILAWTPPRRLQDPIELNRIKENDSQFTVEKMGVNADIYNVRVQALP